MSVCLGDISAEYIFSMWYNEAKALPKVRILMALHHLNSESANFAHSLEELVNRTCVSTRQKHRVCAMAVPMLDVASSRHAVMAHASPLAPCHCLELSGASGSGQKTRMLSLSEGPRTVAD